MSTHRLRSKSPEIEKAFTQVIADLHEILVLDGIDEIPALPGFRIRSHDLLGPLPDIVVKENDDRFLLRDRIENETAKLIAVVKTRQDINGIFPGCRFLPPTITDDGVLVGIRFMGRTVFAEAKSYWEAYHMLCENAVRQIL